MMSESTRTYLPAAGHDWSLPLYDPIVKLLGGDKVRRFLLDQAPLQPGQRVLDIGCGTGTLAILSKRLHPDVEVVGIDPDPKARAFSLAVLAPALSQGRLSLVQLRGSPLTSAFHNRV